MIDKEKQSIFRACTPVDRVPSRASWLPVWLASPEPAPAPDEERAAIQWESQLSPDEGQAALDIAVREFEARVNRIGPTDNPAVSDARQRYADFLKQEDFGEWIPREDARGRLGFDAPGQPIARRWCERRTFEQLPLGDGTPGEPTAQRKRSSEPATGQCSRCGPTGFHDVPIHDGESVRRDCAKCRRFISFPTWHGVPAP